MTNPLPNDPDRKRFLLPFVRVIKRSDAELRDLLDAVSRETEADVARLALKPGIGASVRRGQLNAVRATVAGHLASMWSSAGNIIRARREEAIRVALEAGMDWDKQLLLRAAKGDVRAMLRKSLKQLPTRTLRNMIDRYTRETIPLSQKVYRTQTLANGWVDQTINTALGRGLSAREIAKAVRGSIRSDVRGGVGYAAMRLARTEINAANKFASEHDNAEKPFVENIDWRLSKSHPKRDICDILQANSPYPKDEVPETPHPQCFCYQVPKVIEEDEFVKNLQGGSYDKYLSDKYDLGDEFPEAREEEKTATVSKIIERQPEPEVRPEPAKAKHLDVAQAAWHSGRLLRGEGFDKLPEDAKSDLVIMVTNTLEGLPEKKVAALRSIRVGGVQIPDANAEYDSGLMEIRVSENMVLNRRTAPRSPYGGWYVFTGDQSHLQGTLNHEMGHHLDMVTSKNARLSLYAAMRQAEPDWQGAPDNIGDEFGIDHNNLNTEYIVNNIGTYAATDKWELVAELYASFRGDQPHKKTLANVVGEMLHKDLGEVE